MGFTPNSPIVLSLSALVNAYAGRFETAIAHARSSLRLSPFDPMRFNAELAIAYSCFFEERYDDAINAARRCVHINPAFIPGHALLVASLASRDHDSSVQPAVDHLLKLKPDFRVERFVKAGRFAEDLNERYAAALLRAGLPG